MSTAFSRVFANSRIVECISHSLDFKTITSAASVSQSWHLLWLPIIWHTIDYGQQWQDEFIQTLSRHGHLIRILRCSRGDDISPLISDPSAEHHCRNLTTLVMPKTTLVNQSDQVKLIQQNPGLVDLSLAFRDDERIDYTEIINAVGDHPTLRRLAFDDENKTLQVEMLESILERSKSLNELSFRRIGFFLNHPVGYAYTSASKLLKTEEDNAIENDVKKFSSITSLIMDDVACSQDLILNLASRFPNLERLSLQLTSELFFTEDFSTRLAQRCPHITWLNVSKTEDMDDTTIAGLIRSFPRLHTLIASQTGFSEESLNALIECCPDLEVLDVNETYGIESESIQRLFESCKSLKSLNAWDTYVNVPKMILEAYKSQPTKESATLPSSENSIVGSWICRGLESLTLSFCYDPSSLTSQEQTLIPPASARRYLLEQLSTLTNLKNLSIRTEYYESSGDDDEEDEDNTDESNNSESVMQQIQQDMSQLAVKDALDTKEKEDGGRLFNIAFTLSTGLSILSPLKQLQSLVLYGVDHAVGVQDIQWMCQHWPKFNRIEGLYWNEDYDEDKLVLSWFQKNRPGFTLDEGGDD